MTSPATKMAYVGGQMVSWSDYIAREGLEWDPDLAKIAGSAGELVTMIREKLARAPAAPELPIYSGPVPTTLEEAYTIMDANGTTYRGYSDEVTDAIMRLQAEVVGPGADRDDDGRADAERHLEEQIKIAIEKGLAIPTFIEHLTRASEPIPPNEVLARVEARFAAAAADEARRQAESEAAAAEALKTLEAMTPEEIARMDEYHAAERRRLDAIQERQQRAKEQEARRDEKPEIRVNNRQLDEVTEDALAALKSANNPPRVFARAGIPTRIDTDEDGRPVVKSMDEHMIRHELARAAVFQSHKTGARADKTGNAIPVLTITDVSPPLDVVRNLMALPDLSLHVPALRAIIEAPTIRPDGGIVITPGYDEESGLYYAPSPGLKVPEIPDDPTPEEVAAAAELVKDTICDFPYVVDEKNKKAPEASRANAIAALVTPVLRGMIPGLVPLGLLDKTQMGTGASLLAGAIALVATGSQAHMKEAPESREEWGKEILATLREGRAVVVYDNVEGRFYAPALASVLTAHMYGGRLLGTNTQVSYPNRVCWLATGINIELSGDLPRRCYWVRMDAKDPRPWTGRKVDGEPVKFKHPDLMDWIQRNRGEIIAAILTLARAWVRAKRPAPEEPVTLGGYESWCEVVGGILAYTGIKGFLGNIEDLYSEADADAPQWGAFLEKWYSIWQSGSVTVAGLTKYLQETDSNASLEGSLFEVLPEEVSSAYTKRATFTRVLGAALRHRNGTRYPNGYYLERQREKYGNALQWKVIFDESLVVKPEE